MYLLLLGQFVGRRGRTHATMWLYVIAIMLIQATGTVNVTRAQVRMCADMIFSMVGKTIFSFCTEY